MSNEAKEALNLPQYRCHKVVRAVKILVFKKYDDGSGIIVPTTADKAFPGFPVSAEYVEKHMPTEGGYFVQYEDGYCSFSPAEAFEAGYTRIEPVNTNDAEISHRTYLFDHCTSRLNREYIDVYAVDEVAVDAAHHTYQIDVRQFEQPKNADPFLSVILPFQDGGLAEVGANGITEQALIAVVLHRLRCFNAGPYSCRENAMMITKLEEALMWGEKRANDRARRGVEGERTQ